MSVTTTQPHRHVWRAFAASLAGTSLEWYDFAIYSVASALVFGQLFFPADDPLVGTLLAFSTYAVGYLSRPLGGFLFGRLGDIKGRKHVLVLTLVLIGISTLVIGLLPGYVTLGPWAAVLLVLMRFAQGVGIGGEWGGAVLLSSEFGDRGRRGFWASAAQVGPPLGNLMANGVLALLGALMSPESFVSWGWRIAFLFSAVLVAFGLWIRLKLDETPVFKEMLESDTRPASPLKDVFRTQRRALIASVLSRMAPDVLYAMLTVFVLTYVTTELGMSRPAALTAVLIGSACQLVLMPLAGAVSDKVSRRGLYMIAAGCAAVWPFVFFPLINTGQWWGLALAVVLGLAIHSFMYGPQAALISEQFSPQLRYSGASLSYTLGGVIAGAIAPLIFTALLGSFQSWVPLAVYIAFAACVSITGLSLGRSTRAAEEEDRLLDERAAAAV